MAGSIETSGFPFANCIQCAKNVLVYVDFDADGNELRRCVHCDDLIDTKIAWVAAAELEERGYVCGPAPPAKGCGGGCGSCSMRH